MGYFFSLSKSATSTALDMSEWALLVFGLVLVVGIFGEYKKLPKRVLLMWPASVFEMMVMIGVAGELMGDGGVFLFSRHLQTISDGELAVLNKEAGEARRDAGNANKEAGTARTEAANTTLRAGRLEKDAAQLRRDTVGLQRDVAVAQSMAASANLARAELEARIAPRTLTLAQREYAGRALQRFAGAFFGRRITVHFSSIDPEATVFAVEIRDVILRAGINVHTDGTVVIEAPRFGVQITGTGRDANFVVSLYDLLRRDTDSAFSFDVNRKYDGAPVTIDVSAKPPLGLNTMGQLVPVPAEPQ
jgi:hypothetical protein